MMNNSINFEYAFSEPHVLTLSRPSASEKYLIAIQKSGIRISWTFASQKNDYPLAWTKHPLDIELFLNIFVNNKDAQFSKWYRDTNGIPCLFCNGELDNVFYNIKAISTKHGVVFKIEISNNSSYAKNVCIQTAHLNGWVISNKGWIDGINNNLLLTMNQGRADRIIAFLTGFGFGFCIFGCLS